MNFDICSTSFHTLEKAILVWKIEMDGFKQQQVGTCLLLVYDSSYFLVNFASYDP